MIELVMAVVAVDDEYAYQADADGNSVRVKDGERITLEATDLDNDAWSGQYLANARLRLQVNNPDAFGQIKEGRRYKVKVAEFRKTKTDEENGNADGDTGTDTDGDTSTEDQTQTDSQ